jgi:hypothetical protein
VQNFASREFNLGPRRRGFSRRTAAQRKFQLLQKQRQVKLRTKTTDQKLRTEHNQDNDTLPTEDSSRKDCKREETASVNCDRQQKARHESRADQALRCSPQPIE